MKLVKVLSLKQNSKVGSRKTEAGGLQFQVVSCGVVTMSNTFYIKCRYLIHCS